MEKEDKFKKRNVKILVSPALFNPTPTQPTPPQIMSKFLTYRRMSFGGKSIY
jgi:hypothetical protein